jgi:hypothetical protein
MHIITREQALLLLQIYACNPSDRAVKTVKDVTALAKGCVGELALFVTGAKLYRFYDRSHQPRFAVAGYTSHGRDVTAMTDILH